MSVPEIVQKIRDHGGLAAIHVQPVLDAPADLGMWRGPWIGYHMPTLIGWQNVYICTDGTRFRLTPAQEDEIGDHSLKPAPLDSTPPSVQGEEVRDA